MTLGLVYERRAKGLSLHSNHRLATTPHSATFTTIPTRIHSQWPQARTAPAWCVITSRISTPSSESGSGSSSRRFDRRSRCRALRYWQVGEVRDEGPDSSRCDLTPRPHRLAVTLANENTAGGPEDSDPNAMSSSQVIDQLHKRPMIPGKTATQDKP